MTVTAAPKFFRASGVRGAGKVKRKSGKYSAGMIESVSVITRGEALGHDLWIDASFLEDVRDEINAGGIKARFTHPGLSSDGIGTKLGRFYDAEIIGDQVYADLHFQEAATKTPDGDLADYVMTLAEETPEDFGLSIVFEHDVQDMERLTDENTVNGRFISPDEDNKNNYEHARLAALRAADVVDTPAANPDGLFQRGQDFAQDAEDFCQYIFGLSDAKPAASAFGVDADRAKQFIARFSERHNLNIQKGGDPVSENQVDTAVETPSSREDFAAELTQYVDAFGAENGAKWYTEGIAFAECQSRHIEDLQGTIRTLRAKCDELSDALASIPRGDEEGVEFDADPIDDQPRTFSRRIRIAGKNYDN
jgi:hypothetical protein